MTLVERLGSLAASVRFDDLPSRIRDDVPGRVLDIVGLCAAALPLSTSRAVMDATREQGGAPQATAIGMRERVPAAAAAFVNGVLAHSLDYDDTHLPSILHPSAPVVPAALAVAERHGSDGRALLSAVAAGLEVCVRLGMAGYDATRRQSLFFERGQHATSICGTIGAAAAAAKLAGLDADGIAHAMAIAVSMGAGVIEANRTGGTVKRMHCGWAAHGGVVAADLAARGMTGAPTALEGRFGFYQAWLGGQFDERAIVREGWEIERLHYKPYPANHFTHAGIDAAIALRERGLRASDVAEITLGVAAPTVRTIGEPLDVKRAPETGYQAQFSGPFTVAAALLGGGGLGLGLDDFTDALAQDPVRRALAAKVTVVGDDECAAIYPDQFPAVLTVRTTGGDTLRHKVLENRGGPQCPLTQGELAAKFRDNASRVLTDDAVSRIESTDIAALRDVADLLSPATETKEI